MESANVVDHALLMPFICAVEGFKAFERKLFMDKKMPLFYIFCTCFAATVNATKGTSNPQLDPLDILGDFESWKEENSKALEDLSSIQAMESELDRKFTRYKPKHVTRTLTSNGFKINDRC